MLYQFLSVINEATIPLDDTFEPALLTFEEYVRAVNKQGKSHPDSAYQTTVKRMNQFNSDYYSEYDTLVNRFKVRGLVFELRRKLDGPYGYTWAIFNNKKQKVGTVQDEWGTTLVMVAKEYKGFGFGPLLIKTYRTEYPMKTSGGFTPGGLKNIRKVHAWYVSEYLRRGWYSELVKKGRLSVERAIAIVKSTKMSGMLEKLKRNGIEPDSEYHKYMTSKVPKVPYKHKDDIDLSTKAKDILLYVSDYGMLILYNRRLFTEDDINSEQFEHFREDFILGVIKLNPVGDSDWELDGVYSKDNNKKIEKFLINAAGTWATVIKKENFNEDFDKLDILPAMMLQDRKFRREHDPYREHEYRLLEECEALIRDTHTNKD